MLADLRHADGMKNLLVFGLLATTATPTYAQNSVIYVCVENRSVGAKFEKYPSIPKKIGQLTPEAGGKIIKFLPAELSNGWVTKFPEIEVTGDEETYTYQIEGCKYLDMITDFATSNGGIDTNEESKDKFLFDLKRSLESCASLYRDSYEFTPIVYGGYPRAFYFYGSPYTAEKMNYMEVRLYQPMSYSINEGTCVKK